jgi:aquaporin Z
MQKYLAELIGTAFLVIIGCGAVVIGGFGPSFPLGIVPVALAFGLAVTAMAYAIGPVSGCHINPAVTIAMVTAGRMGLPEALKYIGAQFVGGVLGAFILYLILTGKIGGYNLATGGLGQNGWGAGYLGGYGLIAAFSVEVIATFVFTLVILGATGPKGAGIAAGLIIGLTLVVLHLPFINVTGLSVNPARSFGPALIVGGTALSQVWLFLVAPVIGGALAGLAVKAGLIPNNQ